MSATSSAAAWTAGSHGNGARSQTLTERWNGTVWKQVASPNPGGSFPGDALSGVAAGPAASAWAVGSYCTGSAFKTLIERWNGVAWKQVPSPSPGSFPTLSGVAATSSVNAWAVGGYSARSGPQTLIERWDGRVWKQLASPSPDTSPRGGPSLSGVAATSAANAWAVGYYYNPTTQKTLTLVLHWNGRAWKQVASPSPGVTGLDILYGVAATSATNAWAAGAYYNGSAYQTLVLHWNGRTWKQVASPDPGGSFRGNSLSGVAASSASNAWAVGTYVNSAGGSLTLVLHWNGRTWKQVASPNLGPAFPGDTLSGVAAASAASAWAVGSYCPSTACPARKSLILHWNGKTWGHVASP